MTVPLFAAWRVTLAVQTALHIGDGTRLRRDADYLVEQQDGQPHARIIDVDRALQLMSDRELAQVRDGNIARALGEHGRQQATLATVPIRPLHQGNSPGEVLALIRQPDGTPYIPGSSLKGALRTALLRRLLPKNVLEQELRNQGRRAAARLEDRVFRQAALPEREASGANRDLLRVLRVSDFHARPGTKVAFLETEVRRVGPGGGGQPVLPVWAEAVLRGAKFTGTVSLDTALLGQFQAPDAVRAAFQALPTTLREDGLQTFAALSEWAGGPFTLWAKPASEHPIFLLGWGTGWLAHTAGPLIPRPRRRPLANQLGLGRGRPPDDVPFPRSYKVAPPDPSSKGRTEEPLGVVLAVFAR